MAERAPPSGRASASRHPSPSRRQRIGPSAGTWRRGGIDSALDPEPRSIDHARGVSAGKRERGDRRSTTPRFVDIKTPSLHAASGSSAIGTGVDREAWLEGAYNHAGSLPVPNGRVDRGLAETVKIDEWSGDRAIHMIGPIPWFRTSIDARLSTLRAATQAFWRRHDEHRKIRRIQTTGYE
ncbi:hypothetical protein [Burkholderia arboris]|uniref:hypothetical protein n=1 Tax=Burkholderia arboris TaxID=488730 RepID=UPI0021093C40|nr:hypothetical protein [Burkholderia arboris]UTV59785.1 hypothetical protein NLX30_36955 [Burkholderia arboris]